MRETCAFTVATREGGGDLRVGPAPAPAHGGFLLFLWGAAGVAHELTGWFRLWGVVDRLVLLDGHELYASIVLAVLGGALMVASDRFR